MARTDLRFQSIAEVFEYIEEEAEKRVDQVVKKREERRV